MLNPRIENHYDNVVKRHVFLVIIVLVKDVRYSCLRSRLLGLMIIFSLTLTIRDIYIFYLSLKNKKQNYVFYLRVFSIGVMCQNLLVVFFKDLLRILDYCIR